MKGKYILPSCQSPQTKRAPGPSTSPNLSLLQLHPSHTGTMKFKQPNNSGTEPDVLLN